MRYLWKPFTNSFSIWVKWWVQFLNYRGRSAIPRRRRARSSACLWLKCSRPRRHRDVKGPSFDPPLYIRSAVPSNSRSVTRDSERVSWKCWFLENCRLVRLRNASMKSIPSGAESVWRGRRSLLFQNKRRGDRGTATACYVIGAVEWSWCQHAKSGQMLDTTSISIQSTHTCPLSAYWR